MTTGYDLGFRSLIEGPLSTSSGTSMLQTHTDCIHRYPHLPSRNPRTGAQYCRKHKRPGDVNTRYVPRQKGTSVPQVTDTDVGLPMPASHRPSQQEQGAELRSTARKIEKRTQAGVGDSSKPSPSPLLTTTTAAAEQQHVNRIQRV